MAGGNLSPRQKMINLMYLVFISMLALNMSKEVLSAFGIMTTKLDSANEKTKEKNLAFMASLEQKATDQKAKFGAMRDKARLISQEADGFYNYLEGLREEMKASVNDPEDYETMDKADFLDQRFFSGDKYKPEGQEFIDKISGFRDNTNNVITSLSDSLLNKSAKDELTKSISGRFDLGDENGKVTNREGNKLNWLDYHFKGFPVVASLTKITQMQADVRATEEEVLSRMLQGKLTEEISMTNYTTLLEQPKSAYYPGETFDGKLVLGRKDDSTKPNAVKLTLDGRPLADSDYVIEDGKIRLNVRAGNPGEHKLEGELIYNQDGEEIPVKVSQAFAVIPKPNAAVISADKMNVVYRGVANPMTISIPGIPDNKVSASAAGLRKGSGVGKYIMSPKTGREVTIRVNGKLPDGKPVSSNATFRIKDIPRPSGTVSRQTGSLKKSRSSLSGSTIGATLEDFDFDLNIAVSSFKFKVPGQPTVQVRGSRLDSRAKNALKRAKRGDAVQIFDIKANITNNRSYKLKKVSPVIVEITN